MSVFNEKNEKEFLSLETVKEQHFLEGKKTVSCCKCHLL